MHLSFLRQVGHMYFFASTLHCSVPLKFPLLTVLHQVRLRLFIQLIANNLSTSPHFNHSNLYSFLHRFVKKNYKVLFGFCYPFSLQLYDRQKCLSIFPKLHYEFSVFFLSTNSQTFYFVTCKSHRIAEHDHIIYIKLYEIYPLI